MPEPQAPSPPQWLCAADALPERGTAVLFDLQVWRQPARGFALRIDGRALAYVNRCAHVPTEMDWQPGEFLDQERRYIICTFHGALYEPASGRCVLGPCRGQRLMPIPLREADGQVWWLPTLDIQPVSGPANPSRP